MRDHTAELAKARWVKQMRAEREARFAAERQAAATATDEHREMRSEDLFDQAFKPRPAKYHERQEAPHESVWDHTIRVLGGEVTPTPPAADPAPTVPEADPVPPQETRARQTSAEDLFERLGQQLTITPEAVQLPPETQLRRLFRELPASQREAITKQIEAVEYGLPGYFESKAMQSDYVSVLVGSALGRRLRDAQRLDPSMTPAQLLEAMLAPRQES